MKSQKRKVVDAGYAKLCKAEGHYTNECPRKEKRTSKALFENYEDIIETANTKGYEVIYYEDEDNKSVYNAYT